MEEQIQEYNSLLEESPFFQNMVRQKKTEEGMHVAQRIVTTVVQARFPELTELAQQRVMLISSIDSLDQLAKQIVTAPNEAVAKTLLDSFAA